MRATWLERSTASLENPPCKSRALQRLIEIPRKTQEIFTFFIIFRKRRPLNMFVYGLGLTSSGDPQQVHPTKAYFVSWIPRIFNRTPLRAFLCSSFAR